MAPQFLLSDGNHIPANGFGTYRIPNSEQCAKTVTNAIDAGFRLIDTAEVYGNQEMVGRGIHNAAVPRDQVFVTSKLLVNHNGYYAARAAINHTLAEMKLDYLDLLLIHQPLGDYYGAWHAMEEAQRVGLIRSIGVANFTAHQLIDLEAFSNAAPVINQIEINPWRQADDDVVNCQNSDVQPQAWSPFANGNRNIFQNQTLLTIAKRHHKSVSQVILRWLFQRGIVSVSKTVHLTRMQFNLNIFDFKLSCAEMKTIRQLNRNAGEVEALCGDLNSNAPRDVQHFAQYVQALSQS